MKNETISRLILILEIVAIITFHSVKSNKLPSDKIVTELKEPAPITLQQSPQLVLTSAK